MKLNRSVQAKILQLTKLAFCLDQLLELQVELRKI